MYWTKSFLATQKDAMVSAESASHKLMLRAGMVRMLVAGVYTYLPFGYRVLSKIENIIRDEMNGAGAQELLMPALQPLELWQRTGRDEAMGETMIRFADRKGRKLCLGPTHEEVITELAAGYVKSYHDLPFVLYQIQTKFRDEIRPRFGIVRSCEFIMKDAYSFDRGTEGLDETYGRMRHAYERIFTRCGLNFLSLEADPGVIGGDVSHEFMVPAESGEDVLFTCRMCGARAGADGAPGGSCPRCGKDMERITALEVGHIFKLRQKYSRVMGVKFLDEDGRQNIVEMGCYGIGVSRLMAAVIEQNRDADGIIWPREVAPFDAVVLPLDVTETKISEKARALHDELSAAGLEVLVDDRNERAGVKFKDADLLGIPLRVTVGNKWLKEERIELKERRAKESFDVTAEGLLRAVAERASKRRLAAPAQPV